MTKSRANSEAREKLFAVCFDLYIYILGRKKDTLIHKRGWSWDDSAESKRKKTDLDDQTERRKKTKKEVERYRARELTNETRPIWLLNSKEVTTEEYNEFYIKAFNSYLDPRWHQPTSQQYVGGKTSIGIAYIHETTQEGYDLYLLRSGDTMLIH